MVVETIQYHLSQVLLSNQHSHYRSLSFDLTGVWVDAWCLIQDSPDNKAVELSQMARIYQNSDFTLAEIHLNTGDS